MSTTGKAAAGGTAEAQPTPNKKPKGKLAIYWAASCGGCEISILGIDAKILDVAQAFDIVLCPCITDGKVRDVEQMADGEIDVCLFNGGVRTSEQEYMAQLMRRKSKVLVAFGSCASEGCIPGLGNLHTRQEIFDNSYSETCSTENPTGVRPQTLTKVAEGDLHLPVFYDTLKTLDQTVKVDYYLPGCPPESDRIWEAIEAIVTGQLPPPGSVIGSHTTVCDFCHRTRTEKKIKEFKRTWEVIPDPDTCLLEQGLICCGIATRAGCGCLCPQVNSPCIGCYGAPGDSEDFGARMMSALASVIDSEDPKEIDEIIQRGIPDPVGTFYRFSLAGSLLRRGKRPAAGNGHSH
ncbi:MAG: NADH-quinone oxidoreductase subunit B family protein [Pirellulaceae bacterium]